jgi:hypothetical protein
VTLTATGSVMATYQWTPNVSTSATATVTPMVNTTYIVKGTNSYGCSVSDTAVVTMKSLTSVTITPTVDTICQGSSLYIAIDSTASSTVYPYVWVSNNNPFSTSNASVILPVNNSDTIAVITHDYYGCKDTVTFYITAQSLPSSSFTYTSDLCVGSYDTLKYNGNVNTTLGYPNTYIVWSLNNNALNNMPFQNWDLPVHFTVGGVYNYEANVVGTNGCFTTTSHIITVHSPDKPYIYGQDSICSTDSVLLWVSPTNYQYVWNTLQTTDSIYTHNSGTYKVKMINQWGCIDSTSKKVSFYTTPVANAGRDTTILVGNPVTLNGANSINGYYYEWGVGSNNDTVTIYPTSDITIKLIVTNIHGCKDYDSVTIHVLQCRPPMLPNAFSPNGDGLDDLFRIMNPEDFTSIKSFMIFNRWGIMIYNTNDKSKGWDGKFQGIDQEIGSYVYMITTNCNSGQFQRKGTVVLIR